MNYIQTGIDNAGHAVKIAYNDYGKGNPVILISGWPLSKEMWEYQIDALVNSGHRVIAYDRRGFGQSSQPWDGYDYNMLSDDLKAMIDQLNLDDVTLIGFSMGGGEVVRYFSRHGGQHVSKAVLIGAITPYMLQTTNNPNGVPQDEFDGMINQIKEDRINFLDGFGKIFFGVGLLNKPVSTPLLEYYRNLCSLASPRASVECVKAFATTDFRDEMHTVNVPTLIIHGTADKNVPIDATGKESARVIPNNTFIMYDGEPHGLFYTQRERLNEDLINFLRQPSDASNVKQELTTPALAH